MLAFPGGFGANTTLTAPMGWTEVEVLAQGSGSEAMTIGCFGKIADASDVSATDFTFTFGTSLVKSGIIYRISDAPVPDVFDSDGIATGLSVDTATFSSGVTPRVANSLFIIHYLMAGASGVADDTPVVSIVTGNPTWTERLDVTSASGATGRHVSFTGQRAAATATGDYSVRVNASGDAVAAIILSVSPYTDGSGSLDLLEVSPAFFEPSGSSGSSGSFDFHEVSPTFFDLSGRVRNNPWNNTDKSAESNWNNPDKS